MALRLLKIIFPNGSTGTVYVNNTNSLILIFQVSINYNATNGVLYVTDQDNNAVGDLSKLYMLNVMGSITGSNSFSSNAATTTGITNTTESINEQTQSQEAAIQIIQKGLLLSGYKLVAYQITVYGFMAIQADSIEELRGFI